MNDECLAEGPSTWPKDVWDETTPERAKATDLWNQRATMPAAMSEYQEAVNEYHAAIEAQAQDHGRIHFA